MSSTVTAPPPSGNFLLDLILQPGASLQLVPVINGTLVILLVVLGVLHWRGESNIHFTIMAGLAIGLMASLNW
jgi:ER protein Pkr1